MSSSSLEFDASVGSNLEYGVSWPLLTGEAIVQSTWTVLAGEVTITADKVVGGLASAFLQPTVLDTSVRVLNEITTDNVPARIDSRMIVLSVKRR